MLLVQAAGNLHAVVDVLAVVFFNEIFPGKVIVDDVQLGFDEQVDHAGALKERAQLVVRALGGKFQACDFDVLDVVGVDVLVFLWGWLFGIGYWLRPLQIAPVFNRKVWEGDCFCFFWDLVQMIEGLWLLACKFRLFGKETGLVLSGIYTGMVTMFELDHSG